MRLTALRRQTAAIHRVICASCEAWHPFQGVAYQAAYEAKLPRMISRIRNAGKPSQTKKRRYSSPLSKLEEIE